MDIVYLIRCTREAPLGRAGRLRNPMVDFGFPDMVVSAKASVARILVVRLGAMGDIVHTLPAVASLKQSHPRSHLTWLVERKWAPLLEENPYVDRVLLLDRSSPHALYRSWRSLRAQPYDFAVDFQGLLKSALALFSARVTRTFGFDKKQVRERWAALFYSHSVFSQSTHVVERNLDLAVAAGATQVVRDFPLPPGNPEGKLPFDRFLLASPLAGWGSKQWPISSYERLGALLRRELA